MFLQLISFAYFLEIWCSWSVTIFFNLPRAIEIHVKSDKKPSIYQHLYEIDDHFKSFQLSGFLFKVQCKQIQRKVCLLKEMRYTSIMAKIEINRTFQTLTVKKLFVYRRK